MRIRSATPGDLLAVMNVLDGANLAADAGTVSRRIEGGGVLVAEERVVVGAVVTATRSTGVHVEAIAVRPGRQGQGVGSALLEAAHQRWGRLTAAFDADLRPFYADVGFEIRDAGERAFGVRA